jgi:hypothetical protein
VTLWRGSDEIRVDPETKWISDSTIRFRLLEDENAISGRELNRPSLSRSVTRKHWRDPEAT